MICTLRQALAGAAIATTTSFAAAAPNLLANGSFESGLAGWTPVGSVTTPVASATPIAAITYNTPSAYPTGAFGESVPVPNDASFSPDGAGTHGAYFVDDGAVNLGLSQLVFLAAGNYRIGFDVYAPANGYANPFDARFSATVAGVSLANFMVSTQPATTWLSESGLVTILTSGFYMTSFIFNTPGMGAAKDVVVDRVFITTSDVGGGTVIGIAEPGTLALSGLAMASLLLTRRRKTGSQANN